MPAEENLTCPKCSAFVSNEDKFCKNCGAEMPRVQEKVVPPMPPYERKLSKIQRLWMLLVSPSAAMRDIAEVPEYVGGIVALVLLVVVAFAGLWLMIRKIALVQVVVEDGYAVRSQVGLFAQADFLSVA